MLWWCAVFRYCAAAKQCPSDLRKAMWWYLLFSWTAFPVFLLVLLLLVFMFLRKKVFT
jgi:hypothetical protein